MRPTTVIALAAVAGALSGITAGWELADRAWAASSGETRRNPSHPHPARRNHR